MECHTHNPFRKATSASACCLLRVPSYMKPGGRLELRVLRKQATPGSASNAVSLSHNGLLVHGAHDAIAHQPVSVDHDRLYVTTLPLMHKAGDHAQQRY